jgi:hypothetical protein
MIVFAIVCAVAVPVSWIAEVLTGRRVLAHA